MAKHIKLRKGLSLQLKGKAQAEVMPIEVGGTYAIMPDDFYGFKPKLAIKEGDIVKVGDALFYNKEIPLLKVVSPVSGKITGVVRGERRKLLAITVEADKEQTCKDFSVAAKAATSAQAMKSLLLDAGLFAFIHQRPFDIVANPQDTPRGIYISAFSTMPLAQDFSFAIKGEEDNFQAGIDALSLLAPVTLSISKEQKDGPLAKTKNAELYIIEGKNPAGNVGVQINNIQPVNKGEVVWTIGPEEVIFIGRLLKQGKVDLTRTIAVAGSEVKSPIYNKVVIGTAISRILAAQLSQKEHLRIINGNPLVGTKVGLDGHLSARATEVCVIPEGDDKDEVLGWIMPRLGDYSTSRSYFSWLLGKKEYKLDARIKGGERHIIMSGEYDRVIPMNIYAGFLIKAILTADLDRMEALGIYEVSPEDFAVAEFVDSSKLELQRIVREGLDLLRKELE